MGKLTNLTPLLQNFLEKGVVGNACTVSLRGETVYEGCFGFADREEKRPVSLDTLFRIYSMTKVVTCTAALMLFERGAFALNEPLSNYLPEFKELHRFKVAANGDVTVVPVKNPMLIKHLFTMTSGIPYSGDGSFSSRAVKEKFGGFGFTLDCNVREFCRRIAEVPLSFEPGTAWQYGFSIDVLGGLIEVLSGKTLGKFMKDEIFARLGMTDTSFTVSDTAKLAVQYYLKDGAAIKGDQNLGQYSADNKFESGGGGLISTTRDFLKFANALANTDEILGRKTIDLMRQNHLSARQLSCYNWDYLKGYGYGLGVRTKISKSAGGCASSIGEFGWCGYSGTWVLIDPDEKLAAVYMHQLIPNLEGYTQPRLKAVIYGGI